MTRFTHEAEKDTDAENVSTVVVITQHMREKECNNAIML